MIIKNIFPFVFVQHQINIPEERTTVLEIISDNTDTNNTPLSVSLDSSEWPVKATVEGPLNIENKDLVLLAGYVVNKMDTNG